MEPLSRNNPAIVLEEEIKEEPMEIKKNTDADKAGEVAKTKEKLRISREGFDKAAALYDDLDNKMRALKEQLEKARRDMDYYEARVAKYRRILGEEK